DSAAGDGERDDRIPPAWHRPGRRERPGGEGAPAGHQGRGAAALARATDVRVLRGWLVVPPRHVRRPDRVRPALHRGLIVHSGRLPARYQRASLRRWPFRHHRFARIRPVRRGGLVTVHRVLLGSPVAVHRIHPGSPVRHGRLVNVHWVLLDSPGAVLPFGGRVRLSGPVRGCGVAGGCLGRVGRAGGWGRAAGWGCCWFGWWWASCRGASARVTWSIFHRCRGSSSGGASVRCRAPVMMLRSSAGRSGSGTLLNRPTAARPGPNGRASKERNACRNSSGPSVAVNVARDSSRTPRKGRASW